MAGFLPGVGGAVSIHVRGASFDKGTAEKSHAFTLIVAVHEATQRFRSPRGAGMASMPTGFPDASKSMATRGQRLASRVVETLLGRPMRT